MGADNSKYAEVVNTAIKQRYPQDKELQQWIDYCIKNIVDNTIECLSVEQSINIIDNISSEIYNRYRGGERTIKGTGLIEAAKILYEMLYDVEWDPFIGFGKDKGIIFNNALEIYRLTTKHPTVLMRNSDTDLGKYLTKIIEDTKKLNYLDNTIEVAVLKNPSPLFTSYINFFDDATDGYVYKQSSKYNKVFRESYPLHKKYETVLSKIAKLEKAKIHITSDILYGEIKMMHTDVTPEYPKYDFTAVYAKKVIFAEFYKMLHQMEMKLDALMQQNKVKGGADYSGGYTGGDPQQCPSIMHAMIAIIILLIIVLACYIVQIFTHNGLLLMGSVLLFVAGSILLF
jgi:hypothetical protein